MNFGLEVKKGNLKRFLGGGGDFLSELPNKSIKSG